MSKSKGKHNHGNKTVTIEAVAAQLVSTASASGIGWMLLLGFFGFLLYAGSIRHEYVYDDGIAITQNNLVQQGVSAIPEIFRTNYVAGYHHATSTMYRPMAISMFAVEWSLSPDNPVLGHFINVLFFALTIMLLFSVMNRIMQSQPLWMPVAVTLLFSAHPIHTEVVCNIKSRDELMAFFFFLLTCRSLFRYVDDGKPLHLLWMGLAYCTALLFKESAVSFIMVFPALLWFFSKAEKKLHIRALVILLGVLAFELLLRFWVLSNQQGMETYFLPIHNILISASGTNEHSASLLMLLGRNLVLLLYPFPLSCDYSLGAFPLVTWSSPWAWGTLIVYVALLSVVLVFFRKKPLLVFGLFYYLATMVLYSNIFFPVGATIGERFLFAPSLGICIAFIAILAEWLPARFRLTPQAASHSFFAGNGISFALVAIVVVLFLFKTVDRSDNWKSNLSLFSADVAKYQGSAVLNYLIGNELLIRKVQDEPDQLLRAKWSDSAIVHFNKALSIYPEYGDAYSMRAQALFNTNRYEQALKDYQTAIYRFGSGAWEDYNNLGIIYYQTRQLDSAGKFFLIASRLEPQRAVPLKNLGAVYQLKGDYTQAIASYLQSLNAPLLLDDAARREVYANLIACYQLTGNATGVAHYQQLLNTR